MDQLPTPSTLTNTSGSDVDWETGPNSSTTAGGTMVASAAIQTTFETTENASLEEASNSSDYAHSTRATSVNGDVTEGLSVNTTKLRRNRLNGTNSR
jgi:hypothetical protein